MKLEVLHVPDCANLTPLLERLAEVTDLPVTTRMIRSDEEAERFGMAGSPTLLVDGVDPFAGGECSVSCRLYRDESGRAVAVPSVVQLRAVLDPADVLSAWRTRALPMDHAERTAHHAVLRAFATGHRPGGGIQADVLHRLHDIDAIRLTRDDQVAVAYPFSAAPTRHRVRIAGRYDVYAMCAIDALGIAPMLSEDTVIESTDITSGQQITVVSTNGRAVWDPETAVVFVGSAGRGPSADYCCDYLNFFADRSRAETWSRANPVLAGQILDRDEAEALAIRLFGKLLSDPDVRRSSPR